MFVLLNQFRIIDDSTILYSEHLSFLFARFVEKGNLEVQLFILTSKLRANHQKMYVPPENKALSDINKVCTEHLLQLITVLCSKQIHVVTDSLNMLIVEAP